MANREPKVHVIDGKKYVEVNRQAKVGDKILDSTRGVQTVEKVYDYGVYFYEGILKRYSANWDHVTIEPLESEEVTVDGTQASEQVIEMLANLARRVTSLERQLADTQRNLERQAEDLENSKHRISKHATMFGSVEEKVEMLTDDVITLDERTQVVTAITKFYEGSRR